MKDLITREDREQLESFSFDIYTLVLKKEYDECMEKITAALCAYPHAPHPHNLMGILLEANGDKHGAMKHYRAAIALEPSFRPARENLYRNGDLSRQSSDYTV
ncbi:MAG: hypothetical protein JJU16_07245 [Alkalibacterium sp.]|nr:hypothetical protein [Alkalibacterium sp.]